MSPGDLARQTARITDLIRDRMQEERRMIVAIAGPPASGKSTLATSVVRALGTAAVLVPMDGFHLENAILEARGLLPRKGAPDTFDARGYVTAIRRLKTARHELFLPRFDRVADLAIANAVAVQPSIPVIVTEGNYLLLRDAPWNDLDGLFSLTIFVEAPEDVLLSRLQWRWLRHGLSPDAAMARAQGNDMANAGIVLTRSRPADLLLSPEDTSR